MSHDRSANDSRRCGRRPTEPPAVAGLSRARGQRRVAFLLAGPALLALVAGVGVLASDRPRTDLAAGQPRAIRFGVVSFYNPRLMYQKYQPLVDFLNAHTTWKIELVLKSTYEDTVDGLCNGKLDLAYLGPFTYLRAHEACGARVAVRLDTRRQATFRTYIMVRADSPVRKLEDLAGTHFGFGSIMSTSSHLMPRAMLEDAGLRPGTDVACDYYGHHERAARGVLMGEVTACGVRDLVGDLFKSRGLRVLAESGPLPNFPLALSRQASQAFEEALVSALVDLPRRDPQVAKVLASWDEELSSGFARPTAGEYRSVESLAFRLFGQKAMTQPVSTLACGPER